MCALRSRRDERLQPFDLARRGASPARRALFRLILLYRTLAPFVEASREGRIERETTSAMLTQLQGELEAL